MDFGSKGILKDYRLKDFGKDIFLPFILSCILTTAMLVGKKSTFENLSQLLDFGIIVVPILITLILSAYVLLISIISGPLSDFCRKGKGLTLRKRLNAAFAANLLISLISLLGIFVGNFITKMEFQFCYADIFNSVIYFIFVILVSYPIFCLFGIIIDLFNLCQATRSL